MTRRARWAVLGGLLLYYAWFVHFWPGFHQANEAIRFYFAAAVVDHGSMSVDDVLDRYEVSNVDRAEYRGSAYLDKAPGLSYAIVPLYWAFTRLGMSTERDEVWRLWYLLLLIAVALPAVFGVWCTRGVVLEWTGDERAAWGAALVLGLATPYALYSTLFMGHGPASVLAIAAFFATLRGRPGLAGLAAGLMVLVDTATAPLAVLLGLHAFAWRRRLEDGLWFGLGGMPGVAVQLAYNTWLFGGPFEFSYAHKATGDMAAIHASGLFGFALPSFESLWGLTLGSKRGLLFHAPVLLLGLAALRRTRDASRIAAGAAAGLYVLWIACFVDWPAGPSYLPRHLVVVAPFAAVGVGLALARFGWAAHATAALGVAAMLIGWCGAATFPYPDVAVAAPFGQMMAPLARAGLFGPTLLGLPAIGSLLVAAGVAWVAFRPGWKGAAAAATGVALAAVLWASSPTSDEAGLKSLAEAQCLLEYSDAAAATCEQLGRALDPGACRCH